MNESLHLNSAPNDKVRFQARKTPVIESASPNTPQMPAISCFLTRDYRIDFQSRLAPYLADPWSFCSNEIILHQALLTLQTFFTALHYLLSF